MAETLFTRPTPFATACKLLTEGYTQREAAEIAGMTYITFRRKLKLVRENAKLVSEKPPSRCPRG